MAVKIFEEIIKLEDKMSVLEGRLDIKIDKRIPLLHNMDVDKKLEELEKRISIIEEKSGIHKKVEEWHKRLSAVEAKLGIKIVKGCWGKDVVLKRPSDKEWIKFEGRMLAPKKEDEKYITPIPEMVQGKRWEEYGGMLASKKEGKESNLCGLSVTSILDSLYK